GAGEPSAGARGGVSAGREPAGKPAAPAPASSSENGHSQLGNGAEPDRSHVISPVVRRIAAEHEIDLSAVKGTGVGGRIRKKDVLAHLEHKPEPVLHSESPYRPAPAPVGENRRARSQARRRSGTRSRHTGGSRPLSRRTATTPPPSAVSRCRPCGGKSPS